MGLIFYTLIALVLNCSCGYKLDQNQDQNRHGKEEAQNGEIKTQMINVNDGLLFTHFNRLDLKTLLNMVKENSQYLDIFDKVFQRKYQNYDLCIVESPFPWNTTLLFNDTMEEIEIYDIPFALDMLKCFGHYFQSIKIFSIMTTTWN